MSKRFHEHGDSSSSAGGCLDPVMQNIHAGLGDLHVTCMDVRCESWVEGKFSVSNR